jgi:hypothetical protein
MTVDGNPPVNIFTEIVVEQSFEAKDSHESDHHHPYPPNIDRSDETLKRQQFPQDDIVLTIKDPEKFSVGSDKTIYVSAVG